jgi:hypothetical protein
MSTGLFTPPGLYAQAHEDERLRLIVSNFVVPAARVRGG